MEKGNQTVAYLAGDDSFYELLEEAIELQGISPVTLCEGVCSISMISRVSRGKRLPDKPVRDRLLERLGISDERNENLLDYEDYVKWTEKRDIVKAVVRRETAKARDLLDKYTRSEEFAEPIGQQFYHAMEIQIMRYENATDEQLAEILEVAVKLTVPNIDGAKMCDLQLALKELNLVLEYEKYKNPTHFIERCRELVQYIEHSAMDERSRAKIYPKVVLYLCEAMYREGQGEYSEPLQYMERAIEVLRNTQKVHYLWELLSLSVVMAEKWQLKLLQEGRTKEAEKVSQLRQRNQEWKDALEVLCEVGKRTPHTDNDCYLYMQQEVNCINEIMRRRREMYGISMYKLCKDICDYRTISRMEKENTKTHMAIVRELFARLNLSGELHRTDVVTGSREARDLLEKLIKQTNNFDLEKQQQTLPELEKYLDMRIPLNRQFVKAQQAIISHGGDKNNREKAFELMKEALEYTIDLETIQQSERLYLTGGEISCLYNMAVYTGNLTLNTYHEILLKMCREFEEEDVVEEHISLYAWIMTLIAKVYSNMGEHERAIATSEKVMQAILRGGSVVFAEESLYCVSWNRNSLQKKSTRGERRNRKKELEVCIALSTYCRNIYREGIYNKKLSELDMGN